MSRGRDLDISNNERQFILQAVREGIRLDGRAPTELRSISLEFGSEYGTVFLDLGETKVFTAIQAELVRPRPENPNEGLLAFNTEIAPVSTSKRYMGRASEEEQLLNRTLERCLKRSKAVDTEGLCVLAGEKVKKVERGLLEGRLPTISC